MKIGLYLKDNGFEGIDLSHPELGNPGVGGTEYCFCMLGRYLKLLDNDIDIIYYHYNKNTLPILCNERLVLNPTEAITAAQKNRIDILIFANNEKNEWYEKLKSSNLKTIVWAHCYIGKREAQLIVSNHSVKKVIFVGREEYEYYIDHDISSKSFYIFNMFQSKTLNLKREDDWKNRVTFVGSLSKYKGFHILASVWKDIIKEIPEAELHVIGGGNLYDHTKKMGTYSIAESEYERKFIPYLINQNGEILNSVFFHGVMGREKADILKKTGVGIVNPSARSETFCISAVEMEAYGIPVVTKRKNGLIDTVINGKSGFLFKRKSQMVSYIVKLLRNRDLNEQYGSFGMKFVEEKFDPNKLAKEWVSIFEEIIANKPAKYVPLKKMDNSNYKYVHRFIRFLRIRCGLRWILPFLDMEEGITNLGELIWNKWKN